MAIKDIILTGSAEIQGDMVAYDLKQKLCLARLEFKEDNTVVVHRIRYSETVYLHGVPYNGLKFPSINTIQKILKRWYKS